MIAQRDIWESRYYVVFRKYMTIAGLWPYDAIHKRYLIFSMHLILLLSLFVPQVLYVLNVANSIDDLFECLPQIFILILITFKFTNMIINNKKIIACFKVIEEDWLSLNTNVEKVILRRRAVYMQHITKFYEVIILMTSFLYLTKPFISTILNSDISNATRSSMPRASQLPYHVEYGDKLNHYFFPIMIFCYLTTISETILYIAIDCFYFVSIQHACGMFAIVGHLLHNIGKDSDNNFSFQPDKIEDHNYKVALNCLRKHLRVLQFANLIEYTFTKVLLGTVNINMIVGSITGIQVVINLQNAKNIIAPAVLYISQLVHMFLLFWQAQLLQDFSAIPYESILRGRWYYTSRRCRKILLLIMKNAMSPCKLTAGKIIIFSMESFGTVLKTSLSYFTILRSFR